MKKENEVWLTKKCKDAHLWGCFNWFPLASLGPDIPFVAVYKTQRDGESETQDRESECFHTFLTTSRTRITAPLKKYDLV